MPRPSPPVLPKGWSHHWNGDTQQYVFRRPDGTTTLMPPRGSSLQAMDDDDDDEEEYIENASTLAPQSAPYNGRLRSAARLPPDNSIAYSHAAEQIREPGNRRDLVVTDDTRSSGATDHVSAANLAAQQHADTISGALLVQLKIYYGNISFERLMEDLVRHMGGQFSHTTLAIGITTDFAGYPGQIASPLRVVLRLIEMTQGKTGPGGEEGFDSQDDAVIQRAFYESVAPFWNVLRQRYLGLRRSDLTSAHVRRILMHNLTNELSTAQGILFTHGLNGGFERHSDHGLSTEDINKLKECFAQCMVDWTKHIQANVRKKTGKQWTAEQIVRRFERYVEANGAPGG